ncbi:MAG TPA: YggS family pyridoxal phosphate-dependent enzyme [Vicinamibacterales bacterium]|nr:YggS family pyridoxal phosphate-dependent enzyme [Vicinamibacterales bacterium]
MAFSDIGNRLTRIRARMADAAMRAGRNPAGVRLVAVSKTFPIDAVRAAYAAGQRDFGENRVQEGLQKIAQSTEMNIRWHLIGHLQSNKAKKAAESFWAVHSIDGIDLLERVDRAAEAAGRTPELLVQVDLALEATKHGAPVDSLPGIFAAAAECKAARVTGLMLLPPLVENAEDARPWFRRLSDLRMQLADRGVSADLVRELSMGMSHDFEVAIEEGATMVRIGTAIFGTR